MTTRKYWKGWYANVCLSCNENISYSDIFTQSDLIKRLKKYGCKPEIKHFQKNSHSSAYFQAENASSISGYFQRTMQFGC